MRALFLILMLSVTAVPAHAQVDTTITYQGQLQDSGIPVNGDVSMFFELHDDPNPTSASKVADNGPFTVNVSEGLFQVPLDFGDVNFTVARYLAIRVDGTWLENTQKITNAPLAQYSLGAGAVHWSGVLNAPEFWRLGGNGGTTPGSDFIGTTDNQAFEVHVDGARALRIEPGDGPNVIAGSPANQVTDGAVGASVAGGAMIDGNVVADDFGTVAGGAANVAGSDDGDPTSDRWAAVGGGEDNTASGPRATVGGGHRNEASGLNSTVGGGHSNVASNSYSTVAGGNNGTAAGFYSAIGGGDFNLVEARFGVISGGGWTDSGDRPNTSNVVHDNYGTIGGGGNNRAGSDDGSSTTAPYATVGGGSDNEAEAEHSTIPGGHGSRATRYGEQAYASGYFSEPGDAQASTYVLRNVTTDTSDTFLFLDGSGERLNIGPDRSMTYEIHVIARDVDTGASDGWRFSGVIVNNGTNVQLNGPQVDMDTGLSSWTATVMADDTNKALAVKVNGASGTTIRWVARAETVEVAQP